MSKAWLKGASGACAVAVVSVLTVACHPHVEQHESALPPPVVNAAPIAARAPGPLVRRGVAQYRTRLDLAFSVSGLVGRLLVDRGAVVQKGQLLAVLQANDATAHLRGARAQAERARQESVVTDALVRGGAIAGRQRETAMTDLQFAEARADEAADFVQRTSLRAPISGVINERFVDQGEFVPASRPVLSLQDPTRVIIDVGLTSDEVKSLARDAAVDVTLESTGKTTKGQVSSISPAPQPDDGLYDVEITLSSDAAPGETAVVSIPRQGPASVRVPVSALIYRRDKAHVFVVSGAPGAVVAHLQPVTVARIDSGEAVVSNGVATGERIVVEGGYFLIDGQTVSLN